MVKSKYSVEIVCRLLHTFSIYNMVYVRRGTYGLPTIPVAGVIRSREDQGWAYLRMAAADESFQ